MKTISLKLSDKLHAKLERLAKSRKQTKSEIVRDALDQLVNGTRTTRPVSALDLAGDLAGCLEGPDDLASSPQHMEGYGR
jgi:Arc/MetJ-type ribon-helix-helix transcriptional regulator